MEVVAPSRPLLGLHLDPLSPASDVITYTNGRSKMADMTSPTESTNSSVTSSVRPRMHRASRVMSPEDASRDLVYNSLVCDYWKIVESRRSPMISTLPQYAVKSLIPPIIPDNDFLPWTRPKRTRYKHSINDDDEVNKQEEEPVPAAVRNDFLVHSPRSEGLHYPSSNQGDDEDMSRTTDSQRDDLPDFQSTPRPDIDYFSAPYKGRDINGNWTRARDCLSPNEIPPSILLNGDRQIIPTADRQRKDISPGVSYNGNVTAGPIVEDIECRREEGRLRSGPREKWADDANGPAADGATQTDDIGWWPDDSLSDVNKPMSETSFNELGDVNRRTDSPVVLYRLTSPDLITERLVCVPLRVEIERQAGSEYRNSHDGGGDDDDDVGFERRLDALVNKAKNCPGTAHSDQNEDGEAFEDEKKIVPADKFALQRDKLPSRSPAVEKPLSDEVDKSGEKISLPEAMVELRKKDRGQQTRQRPGGAVISERCDEIALNDIIDTDDEGDDVTDRPYFTTTDSLIGAGEPDMEIGKDDRKPLDKWEAWHESEEEEELMERSQLMVARKKRAESVLPEFDDVDVESLQRWTGDDDEVIFRRSWDPEAEGSIASSSARESMRGGYVGGDGGARGAGGGRGGRVSISAYENLVTSHDFSRPLFMHVPQALTNEPPKVGQLEVDQVSDLSENDARSHDSIELSPSNNRSSSVTTTSGSSSGGGSSRDRSRRSQDDDNDGENQNQSQEHKKSTHGHHHHRRRHQHRHHHHRPSMSLQDSSVQTENDPTAFGRTLDGEAKVISSPPSSRCSSSGRESPSVIAEGESRKKSRSKNWKYTWTPAKDQAEYDRLYPDTVELLRIASQVEHTPAPSSVTRTSVFRYSLTEPPFMENGKSKNKEHVTMTDADSASRFIGHHEPIDIEDVSQSEPSKRYEDEDVELDITYDDFERLFDIGLVSRSQVNSGRVSRDKLATIQNYLLTHPVVARMTSLTDRDDDTGEPSVVVNCGPKTIETRFYERDYLINARGGETGRGGDGGDDRGVMLRNRRGSGEVFQTADSVPASKSEIIQRRNSAPPITAVQKAENEETIPTVSVSQLKKLFSNTDESQRQALLTAPQVRNFSQSPGMPKRAFSNTSESETVVKLSTVIPPVELKQASLTSSSTSRLTSSSPFNTYSTKQDKNMDNSKEYYSTEKWRHSWPGTSKKDLRDKDKGEEVDFLGKPEVIPSSLPEYHIPSVKELKQLFVEPQSMKSNTDDDSSALHRVHSLTARSGTVQMRRQKEQQRKQQQNNQEQIERQQEQQRQQQSQEQIQRQQQQQQQQQYQQQQQQQRRQQQQQQLLQPSYQLLRMEQPQEHQQQKQWPQQIQPEKLLQEATPSKIDNKSINDQQGDIVASNGSEGAEKRDGLSGGMSAVVRARAMYWQTVQQYGGLPSEISDEVVAEFPKMPENYLASYDVQ